MLKLLGILSLAILTGCATKPPMPGRLVDVNGHKMHINCTGPEDSGPVIVIDGGLSSVVPFYSRLQSELAAKSRTCTYDRAGLGYSDKANTPREAQQIAAELHTLLKNANVPAPYVLAGHSLGGLIVIRYVHDYPQDVVGIALLDSSHPDQYSLDPNALDGEQRSIRFYKRARIAAYLGVLHFYNPIVSSNWYKELPLDAQKQIKYFSTKAAILTSTIGEMQGFRPSMAQAAETKTLGDTPMVVITAGKQYMGGPNATPEVRERWQKRADGWYQLHEQYSSLSTRSRHVTVPTAEHMTLISNQGAAAQVAEQILLVVSEARSRMQ